MKQIVKELKMIYWGLTTGMALFALVIEFVLIDSMGGSFVGSTAEFIYQSCMILLTLGGIYACLRYFKFGFIQRQLKENTEKKYKELSILRFGIIEMMVCLNLFGYLFFVSASFAWLAVISAMTLFFVYPSEERYCSEVGFDADGKSAIRNTLED